MQTIRKNILPGHLNDAPFYWPFIAFTALQTEVTQGEVQSEVVTVSFELEIKTDDKFVTKLHIRDYNANPNDIKTSTNRISKKHPVSGLIY